ncbi:MAG: alpha/beta hydrolase [Rikenellaceae bacterium]|nr:alpha/beta hydrolase [Rikenellaceae bacterium]
MKRLLTLCLLLLAAGYAVAQPKAIEVDLWPNGAPKENGLTGPEQPLENGRVANISRATLYIYPAPIPNAPAIIACPGGGYRRLAMNHEGHDMATWFNKQGITYAVLKYRMPNGDITIPISDALKAIRTLRERAAEWNIDPQKVGIMGASAGGNLAAQAATQFTSEEDRPDFQILFYASLTMSKFAAKALLNGDESEEAINRYWPTKQVKENTPPAFLLCSADDRTVPCENSIDYFKALRAKKIEATLHIYPTGGHGWGYEEWMPYKREWTAELEQWLEQWTK